MSDRYFKGRALRRAMLGAKLDRDTADVSTGAYKSLFNIINAPVMLTSMVGEVTTALQSGANNTKLTATPTTGTAVDLASNLDTVSDEKGCLFGISAYGSAMVGTNAGATVITAKPIVLQIGTVGITTASDKSGSIKWSVTYMPLEDGGEMTVV